MLKGAEFESIKEVEGDVEAQKMLEKGWKLIETSGGKDEDGFAYILYSFGKPKSFN